MASEFEVHLLLFYIEFRFEDASSRQYFVNVVFLDCFQENVFTGCSLDPEREVHLLRFYIEFRFEKECYRQHFVNVVFRVSRLLPGKRICRILPRPRA